MEKIVGCDGDFSICIPKYKRRKVSARRNFPKGCGRNDPQITSKHVKDTSATNGPKGKSNLDSFGVVDRELQTSKNFEPKKCPHGVAADSPLQIVIVPSQPEKLMTDTNILVKTWCGKFPPRRRISSTRTFPLNFRRNVSENTKDEHIKAKASSVCTTLTHMGAENKDKKSNQSNNFSPVESEEASKDDSNASCKNDRLFTLNSDEKAHDKCQARNVLEFHDKPGSCSIGTSEELRYLHSEGTSCVEKSDSENRNVASNVEVSKLDSDLGTVAENNNFDPTLENEVDVQIVVHSEEKGSIFECSHSTEIREGEVNVYASRAVPASVEIIDLEDNCSRIEFSSKTSNNSVIPNCPCQPDGVVDLSSPSGKKKSDAKKPFDKIRELTSLSKRRKVRTNLKANYPYVTVVEVDDNEKCSFEQDEKCDDDSSNLIIHGIDLAPAVPKDAGTHNDSDDCISHSKVRETLQRTSSVFRESMQKDESISIRGATCDEQRENINTCAQNKRSVPVQPEIASKLNLTKRSKRSHFRHGICHQDISNGIERIPILAINIIDDQQPPSFKYITRMLYPDWCRPLPLMGCNCVGGCSDSPECACAVRNGGEIPFEDHGRVVERKPLVYECGPSCKCPPSCPNRVSQLGIKYRLEVFKTESRGWGVRSRNRIPSGGFICEYLGELLEDKQAEQRIGSDEYLFDIGSNISDQEDTEVVNDVHFTIDANRFGNVGRFINHSCSPNLYAQDLLYDHENKRIPHVMLFAAEDIPPLQELTYDYNYHIGDVSDPNGNMKTKQCLCGSKECIGRLY